MTLIWHVRCFQTVPQWNTIPNHVILHNPIMHRYFVMGAQAAHCCTMQFWDQLRNECDKGNKGVIPFPGLTMSSISWKCVWKICLTNNVSKSVFVIVNCTTDRVEFDKKWIFFLLFCPWNDLDVTLLWFIINSILFEHLTNFWNTKIDYKYGNTQFSPLLASRMSILTFHQVTRGQI